MRSFILALVIFLSTLPASLAQAETALRSESTAAGAISGWERFSSAVVRRSADIAASLRDFPQELDRAVDRIGEGRGWTGFLENLGLIILIFLAAALSERFIAPRVLRIDRQVAAWTTRSLGERLSEIAGTAFASAAKLLLFIFVAVVAMKLIFSSGDLARELAVAIGLAIVVTRILSVLIRLALSPSRRINRLIPIPDDGARFAARWSIAAAALCSTAYFGSGFLALIGFSLPVVNAWLMTFWVAVTVVVLRLVWKFERGTKQAETYQDSTASSAGKLLRKIGGNLETINYRRLIAGVFGAALVLWWINSILDRPQQANAVLLSAALVALFLPIDRCYRTLLAWAIDPSANIETLRYGARDWPLHYRLIILVMRLAIISLALVLALEAWGVPIVKWLAAPIGRRLSHAAITLAISAPIAMLIWHGSEAYLTRRFGGERGPDQETPGTRLHTLLPIMRGSLLVVLFVIVVLMVLAALGVEIGPLIAGAGVVGVAVGFGAQALVRDIFSGFFFLIDDAFRIGEYVDVGKVKGTVERISIRSIQLRHHRGALHTIPYGQIQTVSNYQRDWVIEKLELNLIHGTDPKAVRKLIKKIGQELMENPEFAPEILETLKSQGVNRFGSSGPIFRVKIKCRPGKQFQLLWEANHRIQQVFAENGILFSYQAPTRLALSRDEAPNLSRLQQAKS